MAYFENSSAEAESAFYAAFEHLDLDLMKATWHQSDDVFCIHPGGPIQSGYERVLKHWAFILENSEPAEIDYKLVKVFEQDSLAIHLVEETIGSGDQAVTVLVTNTYIKTREGWRLLSHHASLPPSEQSVSGTKKSIH